MNELFLITARPPTDLPGGRRRRLFYHFTPLLCRPRLPTEYCLLLVAVESGDLEVWQFVCAGARETIWEKKGNCQCCLSSSNVIQCWTNPPDGGRVTCKYRNKNIHNKYTYFTRVYTYLFI